MYLLDSNQKVSASASAPRDQSAIDALPVSNDLFPKPGATRDALRTKLRAPRYTFAHTPAGSRNTRRKCLELIAINDHSAFCCWGILLHDHTIDLRK